MACNKCKSVEPTCGCQEPIKFCGCPVKVDSKCVIYDSTALTPLGVIKGDNLEEIIKIINDLFSDVYVKIDDAFIGINTGLGKEIYKGQNVDGKEEFRTLEQGTGILLVQTADSIEVKVDTEWFEDQLKNFVITDWFIAHIQDLIKQQWFIDYLQTIFLEPWFGETIKHWVKQDWFTTYLSQILKQPWFISILQSLLRQQWFTELLFELFDKQTFKNYFADYFTSLINSGAIDICALISKCAPKDSAPTMIGDVTYNVPNRAVDFPINKTDFSNKFVDADGDTLVAIRITGGVLTNLTKTIGGVTTPLAINDVIPYADINSIRFSGLNQNAGYTQTVTYVGIASNGVETN